MNNDDDNAAQLQAQGWTQRTLAGFIETVGPLWTRSENGAWAYGILCGPQHLNPAGVVHGGMLMTLMDHAISTVAWQACERVPCITVQLDTHFVGAVKTGEFAQARAEVAHRTRGLIFMRGSVTVRGLLVVSAQAVLKVIAPVQAGKMAAPALAPHDPHATS